MSVSIRVQEALDWGWLRDDREEDLVGADRHQNAIRRLVHALRTLAEERDWPWHVGDQLTLVGPKPDGTLWRPAPDISVHSTLGSAEQAELDVQAEGPPGAGRTRPCGSRAPTRQNGLPPRHGRTRTCGRNSTTCGRSSTPCGGPASGSPASDWPRPSLT